MCFRIRLAATAGVPPPKAPSEHCWSSSPGGDISKIACSSTPSRYPGIPVAFDGTKLGGLKRSSITIASIRNPSNTGDPDWGSRQLLMHYYDDGSVGEKELAIFINMEDYPVDFSLPGGREWARVVDTQAYWDSDDYLTSDSAIDPMISHNVELDALEAFTDGVYGVQPNSIVIFEQL